MDRKDQVYEDIVQTVREPLLVLDSDLKVILASRKFNSSFKITQEETFGNFIYDLGNKQWDIPPLRKLLETILPQNTTFDNYEVEHDFAAIGRRTMLLNARQIKQGMDEERIILLAIEDLTERKKIEADLEKTRKELVIINNTAIEARNFAENVITTLREPLISLDQDLRVITVSRSFYEVFKVTPEETVGQLIYEIGNKQWDIPQLRELLETILPQKTSFEDFEVEHDFATIGRRTMLLNARQVERGIGNERIILLAIEDITERKNIEKKLEYMAFHDPLTGLPNRQLFSDRLVVALAQAKRNKNKVGIVMLDLDNFKEVNDTLGHDIGDILLKAVAARLSAALRESDTIARRGGDEFLLILPDLVVVEDAKQIAQKIVNLFKSPFLIDAHQLVITTSIGISIYPHDGIDEGILLKNADIAMYQAKQAGGNRHQLYKKA
jgi:diguanylate cyclase (GGDEF)-like protein/PAS domain S-box-containing protein